jgi:GntR family transcriptional regulator, transcriptional repressor for pyruvate dehydrogenase complex
MTSSATWQAPAAPVPAQWRPIAKAKTYQLVLDRIEEQILTRELRPGDRLPPERELAAQLGVSRPAVREALRALQVQGVLQSCVGNGPDAGTTVVPVAGEALTRLLRLHVGLAGFGPDDVLEVRVMLERTCARLAAAHATSADLPRFAGLLARLADPALPADAAGELDAQLHQTVAVATGSPLLAALTGAVRGAQPAGAASEVGAAPAIDPGALDRLRVECRALYDRIAAGDAAGAANLLDRHVRDGCPPVSSPRA